LSKRIAGAEEKAELASQMQRKDFRAGDVVAATGTILQGLNIVSYGVLTGSAEENGSMIEVSRLAPGDYFGETGLLTNQLLHGEIVAQTTVVIYEIVDHHSQETFSAASGTNHGSRNVTRNSSTCRKQSRPNASANASDVTAGLGAADKRHPRKVEQSVVSVGPPRRCTMLREVVAIGRSRLLTEAYAAEREGIPTALSPAPRTKRAHASTAATSP
jgi:CRP-like cAMP-binding protein